LIKLGVLGLSIVLLLSALTFSSVYASHSGTWYIYYYFAGSNCSGSPYSPTLKDGGGFAVNQPPNSNQDPIVPGGSSIDVKITVTGATPNEKYYYEVDSLYGPVPLFTTDSSGDGTACIEVTIPISSLTTSSKCFTVPQKIGVGGTSTEDFDGNIIDHFLTGGGCTPTTSVPEFPAGLSMMLALLIPALILIRRKSISNY
jgi:hypothetical protein